MCATSNGLLTPHTRSSPCKGRIVKAESGSSIRSSQLPTRCCARGGRTPPSGGYPGFVSTFYLSKNTRNTHFYGRKRLLTASSKVGRRKSTIQSIRTYLYLPVYASPILNTHLLIMYVVDYRQTRVHQLIHQLHGVETEFVHGFRPGRACRPLHCGRNFVERQTSWTGVKSANSVSTPWN